MVKILSHSCAWLQQNHELALLATVSAASVGFLITDKQHILLLLPFCIAVIGGGVLIAKIRSRMSLRVPATEIVWLGVFAASCGAVLLSSFWPEFQVTGVINSCLWGLFASFYERKCRYQMARNRVQKRRSQQAKWRVAKREVLHEWKDRLRWLAGVQHDMRQPLHALGLLIGHPDLVKAEGTEQVVKRIHSCHRWLQELAENTLEATRFELNETRVTEVSTVSSAALCKGLESWTSQLAESKGLDFLVDVEDQIIRTDVRRLKRVLGNLLFNAVEHSFDGQVSLRYKRTGGVHQFVVKDNGPGISESVINPSTDKKSAFGSDLPKAGIGLYVVRKLCLEMEWNLILNNEISGGATFVLELADRIANESGRSAEPKQSRKLG